MELGDEAGDDEEHRLKPQRCQCVDILSGDSYCAEVVERGRGADLSNGKSPTAKRTGQVRKNKRTIKIHVESRQAGGGRYLCANMCARCHARLTVTALT